MAGNSKKPYSSLTEVEVEGLHTRYNFADGHAYHDMPAALQPVIDNIAAIWNYAKSKPVPDIEEEFKRSKASLIRSSVLATHPHYSISPTASNSIDIVGAWMNMKGHSVGLLEPAFDNLSLLLKRRKVKLVSFQENDLLDTDQLVAKIKHHKLDSIFIVNPNNPTGFQLDQKQFEAVCGICARNQTALIVDTTFRFYSQNTFDTYRSLKDSGVDYVVIEDTGKTWPTLDMKVGLMAYSGSIAKDIRNIYEEVFLCSSNFTLALIGRLMDKTQEVGLDKIVWQETEKRARHVESVLASAPLTIVRPVEACLLPVVWLDCSKTGLTDVEFVGRLKTHHVSLLPGRFFYWDSRDQHTSNLRLSLMRPESGFNNGLIALQDAIPKVITNDGPTRNNKTLKSSAHSGADKNLG